MEQRTFEGTWEEILLHAPELVGQRVHLTVLPSDGLEHQQPVMLDQLLKGRVGQVRFQPSNLSTRTKAAFSELLSDKYNLPRLDQ
ncbi:MAG: hypothetical protein AAFY26_18810 [Cyanobacteria bacterium J06638_22]